MSMDTIDFSRLPLAGQRVLDVGCGEGRHCLSAGYHGAAQVVGVDLAEQDLATARQRQQDFESGHGALPPITFLKGSALDLPFEDGSFDGVLCSEVLEHIFPYEEAIAEIVRVVRPGGWVALSVPRAWPEKICWALSDAYHEAEGGHIRIFEEPTLQRAAERAGLRFDERYGAHALHVPYWWLRCLFGGDDAVTEAWPVRLWHRLLLWDLLEAPPLTRTLERWLNPVLGKSVIYHFRRPAP